MRLHIQQIDIVIDGTITIEGMLIKIDNDDFSLTAASIFIEETGTLQVGVSQSEPYLGQAIITLTGAPDPSTTSVRDDDNAMDNDGLHRKYGSFSLFLYSYKHKNLHSLCILQVHYW